MSDKILMKKDLVRSKRILIVDDEKLVRESARMLLEIDGHRVTEAEDGREALGLFEAEKFDLIITDYKMRGMSGAELAVRIKEISPEKPILMITAFYDEPRGAANPVDRILRKPYTFAELRESVKTLTS